MADSALAERQDVLPERFRDWFAARGWTPRAHQLELLRKAATGRSSLLIAPTGAGKTLAGFLPSLVELAGRPRRLRASGLHTLYVSPLKALAVDIARNLERPVAEMGLPVTLETRTGDTSQHKRRRQRSAPPDVLLTTPEQVALLIASPGAELLFAGLRTVVFDELHALMTSKRGDLLSLGLARLRALAPDVRTIGLSATVAEPDGLRAWLVGQPVGASASQLSNHAEPERAKLGRALLAEQLAKGGGFSPLRGSDTERSWPAEQIEHRALAELVIVDGGAKPDITILKSADRVPWAGHSSLYALHEIYAAIHQHRMSLLFVNTRSQAERIFQALWRANEDGLAIALHHGSLDAGQRRKVEKAMAAGELRAVVCTSTLDLGIDWGDVDLVIHIGGPKGASRLTQRIGRANHRLDEPSKAILVPSNRFEVLECRAALDANDLGAQDTPPIRAGALDVLAQHVLGRAAGGPFDAAELYGEVRSALPYSGLDQATFDRVVDFVATGGYALKNYEQYAKIRLGRDGLWRVTHPRIAQQYRLNIGTILEAPLLNVRVTRMSKNGVPLRGGRILGKIEEYFLETLARGDTFLFAGLILRFEGIRENEALATRTADETPKIPVYAGGKFPLTTYLADGVRRLLADRQSWSGMPGDVGEWLSLQDRRSVLPRRDELLVETFPRGLRHYLVCYPFEGRLAHQTLGMLLTRRLERARLRPLGFVATDYSLGVWGLGDIGSAVEAGTPGLGDLFDEDMLGDDLEAWMAESYLLKRMFRGCATISGLVAKRYPGEEKTGRQVTVSTDLIYDVLRRHEPDHILMRATWEDAATGLLDVTRLGQMLSRIRGRIRHKKLDRVSPLALPIMLEIGKEAVGADGREDVLREAAEDLVREAMGDVGQGLEERTSGSPSSLGMGAEAGRAVLPPALAARSPQGRSSPIELAGIVLEATMEGCLWWTDERLLVVADLHLEKGSSLARQGQFLPPYDTCETLAALGLILGRLRPRRVVALGDSFHDEAGAARLAPADRDALRRLQAGREWIWMAGNHDHEAPSGVEGDYADALAIGPIVFRHEPTLGDAPGEIAGHLHPAARVAARSGSVRTRCFVGDGVRLVMPAFGAYAGGLNVLDGAFGLLFPSRGRHTWMLGRTGIYAVRHAALRPD